MDSTITAAAFFFTGLLVGREFRTLHEAIEALKEAPKSTIQLLKSSKRENVEVLASKEAELL